MPELSCPYCTGPMEIVSDGRDMIGEGWIAWAYCPRCSSRGPVSSFHRHGFDDGARRRAKDEAARKHAQRTRSPDPGGT